MNGGRQRGTKLCSPSSVARHEKRVLTIHSSPPAKAMSWMRMSPVTWWVRGRKQASWRPLGSSLCPTAGWFWYTHTPCAVPRASRSAARAMPIGLGKDAEVRVDAVAVGPHDDHPAALVGRHEQRAAELVQQRGHARGVDAAQRLGGAGGRRRRRRLRGGDLAAVGVHHRARPAGCAAGRRTRSWARSATGRTTSHTGVELVGVAPPLVGVRRVEGVAGVGEPFAEVDVPGEAEVLAERAISAAGSATSRS